MNENYYKAQYGRLLFASDLCFRITSKLPLDHNFEEYEQFLVLLYVSRKSKILVREQTYIRQLHEIFFVSFSWLAKRVDMALPQYTKSIEILKSAIPVSAAVYSASEPEDCRETLAKLSRMMEMLEGKVILASEHDLEKLWEELFVGCNRIVKACEELLEKMQLIIADANGLHEVLKQNEAIKESNAIATNSNLLSQKSNEIADSANTLAEKSNDIANASKLESIKANRVAAKALLSSYVAIFLSALIGIAAIYWQHKDSTSENEPQEEVHKQKETTAPIAEGHEQKILEQKNQESPKQTPTAADSIVSPHKK